MKNESTYSRARAVAVTAAAVFMMVCAGCSKPVPICPVSGQVLVNGKPAEGAYVVFTALDGADKTRKADSARTEKDGSYLVRVEGPGQYAITVFWPTITVTADETIEGEDRFNGKYHKVDHPILKTTIQEGDNLVPPIQLKLP